MVKLSTFFKVLCLASIVVVFFCVITEAEKMYLFYAMGLMIGSLLGMEGAQMTRNEWKERLTLKQMGPSFFVLGAFLFCLGSELGLELEWVATLSYAFLLIGSIMILFDASKTTQ